MQDPKVPEGLIPFLDWFYTHYGRWPTLGLIFLLPAGFIGLQIWQHRRKDRSDNAALQAKEDTIQRLAEDNRMYRAVLFKEKFGWTDEKIDAYVVKVKPAALPPAKKGKKKS